MMLYQITYLRFLRYIENLRPNDTRTVSFKSVKPVRAAFASPSLREPNSAIDDYASDPQDMLRTKQCPTSNINMNNLLNWVEKCYLLHIFCTEFCTNVKVMVFLVKVEGRSRENTSITLSIRLYLKYIMGIGFISNN